MIRIFRLKQRNIDPDTDYKNPVDQIKLHVMKNGHGLGTIDFAEQIMEIEETDYKEIANSGGEYTRFKLGNLMKYFEIDLYPEHAERIKKEIPDSKFRDLLNHLEQGFLTLRMD